MTKPIDLWLGARVEFWRSFPLGKGFFQSTNLKRQNARRVSGTVVSLDPLRVLWDITSRDREGNDGPPMEFPLGGPTKGYDRSCIKLLSGQHPRDCDNCYYAPGGRCPVDNTVCENSGKPEGLHKWRWEHDPTVQELIT